MDLYLSTAGSGSAVNRCRRWGMAARSLRRTEEVCKWVAASEEFPEDVIWVAECEMFVEMLSVVEMAP